MQIDFAHDVLPWLLFHPVAVTTGCIMGLVMYLLVTWFGSSLGWPRRRRVLMRLLLPLLLSVWVVLVGWVGTADSGYFKMASTIVVWFAFAPPIIVLLMEWFAAAVSWVWEWSGKDTGE